MELNRHTANRLISIITRQKYLHIMAVPGVVWMTIFCYIPMAGLVIAFQEFDTVKGYVKSPFVGLSQFKELFSDEMFWNSFRNTLGLSLTKIIFSILTPILFAILLNEVSQVTLKKVVQTASYLPHFISWVVVAGIFSLWLDREGMVNQVLMAMRLIHNPVSYLGSSSGFWIIMALIDTWKETGWWAIIYIAAIAGIPIEIYEAGMVDGVGRIRRIFNITLPSIKNTIIIVFILTMGSLIYGGLSGSNFNQSLLFGNPLNYDNSRILDTYVLNIGLSQGRFSLAAAAGMIQSVLSLILLIITNNASRAFSETSLY